MWEGSEGRARRRRRSAGTREEDRECGSSCALGVQAREQGLQRGSAGQDARASGQRSCWGAHEDLPELDREEVFDGEEEKREKTERERVRGRDEENGR